MTVIFLTAIIISLEIAAIHSYASALLIANGTPGRPSA